MYESVKLIQNARIKLDLNNQQIADRMGALMGKPVSADTVQKYFAGNSGVPMESIGPLLCSLGLKVVDQEDEVISKEKLRAYQLFAKEAIESDLKEDDE